MSPGNPAREVMRVREALKREEPFLEELFKDDEIDALARAAIEAHTAALSAAGMVIEDDWRPIDSAPKKHRVRFEIYDPVDKVSLAAVRFDDAHGNEIRLVNRYDDRRTASRCTHWRPERHPTPTLPPAGDER